MKNKRFIIFGISLLVTLVLIIAAVFGVKIYKESRTDYANLNVKDVSMIQLIATPEKYDGEFVRVCGVGNIEFEGNCISLSKDDLIYGGGNSIWISLNEDVISYEEAAAYNGEYVTVEGIFDKDNRGHMDSFLGSINNVTRYTLQNSHILYRATTWQETDSTYSYSVMDYDGKELLSGKGLSKEPERKQIDTDTVSISVQTGTGLSTARTVFCDLRNSKASETFYYVLNAQDEYVVYADRDNDKCSIIVQNIFDKSVYYKVYELENVSPAAADFTVDCKSESKGCVTVTYLAGEDYTETDITINFP